MEARVARASFIGRTGELEGLEEALAAAAAGRGSTFLIAGEAGIGKTRLVSELAERARKGGTTVLTGRCIDLVGQGVPYLPLVEALRPLRRSPALAGVPPGLRELSRLVPELAGPEAVPAERVAGDAQLQLFQELLALFEGLSAAAPLVLVLEDLHWADGSTLDLVTFLAHAVGEQHFVIVATYRSDELAAAAALRRLVGELLRARKATVLELGPLDRDEIEQLVAVVAEASPGELATTIYERSEGNPFFAEELLAAAARGDETLPRVLHDALLQRVARLDAVSRSVLRMAAAAGRDVPYALLAAVISLPEQQLLESLEQAVEHGVLVPDQHAGEFRFRHALLAEVVYSTLLPGEREAVHGRLARALADDPTLVAGRSATGEAAQHWAAARRPVEALVASVQAARDAEAVSGLAEALQHLERVLELWPQVDDAEALVGLDLGEALRWAAEVANFAGAPGRAAELVRQALALPGAQTNPVQLGLMHERLAAYLLAIGEPAAAMAAYERAVELVPAEPPSAERATVLAAYGRGLMRACRYDESKAACEQALGVGTAIGDDRPTLRARAVLGAALCRLGSGGDAVTCLRDARDLAREYGSVKDELAAYGLLSDVLLIRGRLAEAADDALEGLAKARRHGYQRSFGVNLSANAAEALLGLGEWSRAEEVLESTSRDTGAYWFDDVHMVCTQLALGRGRLDLAREHLELGAGRRDDPQGKAQYAALEAELALWQARFDDALEVVDRALHDPEPGDLRWREPHLCALGLRALVERIRQAAVRRDAAAIADARSRGRALLERARRSAPGAAAVSPEADGWTAVAESEHTRVEGTSSPERWQDSVGIWEQLERPYLAAYCRWRLAEALLAAGASRIDAALPAREAHHVARRLAAAPLAHELEQLARRARLDLAGVDANSLPDAGDTLGLTAREREVLQLLARGYTNREIASELTISVKTASAHVSHILRKLDVTSRLEAAEIAHRLAPPPPAAPER